MANELVKHGAELNTIPLRKFTPTEMNLFFSIVSRLHEKNNSVVRFSFEQLKELSAYKPTANIRFIDDIQSTYEKLLELRFSHISKTGLRRQMFVMFTQFDINGEAEDPYVDVQIHEMAIPLLNGLESWVRYSLTEFRELNSSYSKTMFRLLKQFRTTGYAEFSKEAFFELLDIPKSYWSSPSNVDKFILKPIKEELTPIFRGLSIRKKYSPRRGKPVIGYKFAWKAESKTANDWNKGKEYPEDLKRKLFNIEYNGNLSLQEKYRAKDRLLNLPLGTHESNELDLQKKEREKELEKKEREDFINSLSDGSFFNKSK